MPIEIIVPRLGWSMEEGHFVGWLKKEGEFVRAGDALFSIEGDKAVQEIEAIDSGVLSISPDAPKPGGSVRVGDLLGFLRSENETISNKTRVSPKPIPSSAPATKAVTGSLPGKKIGTGSKPSTTPAHRPAAISPRALRAAKERGVDWTRITGTGRTGRIRERDILAAASRGALKMSPD